jgi:hypothetical protein
MQGRAKATRPVLALEQKLDYFLSMRASLAAVALFVMLVERVGSPEASVTTRFRTRVLPPAFVKLVFVPLPVILPFETGLT